MKCVRDYGNKEIFAANLRRYMHARDVMQKDVADAIGVSQSTFNDWATGHAYPRIDKIDLIAEYFGCLKSDLIEDQANIEKKTEYYLDPMVARRAQEIYDRPQLGLLMDASRKLSNEDLDAVLAIVNRMKGDKD